MPSREVIPERRSAARCARTARPPTLLVAVLALLATGCADWSYARIRLGMTQRECERTLPEGVVWRTELGLCCRRDDYFGRSDALVVLVSHDQRVVGQFQATQFSPHQRLGRDVGYRLRGELDPKAAGLEATGPLDTLRAVADDLAAYRGAQAAMETHAFVAAGLVRLLERWPTGTTTVPHAAPLADMLERVPGGGVARLNVDPAGTYTLEYRQRNLP